MKLKIFGLEMIPRGRNYDTDWVKSFWSQANQGSPYSLAIWYNIYNKGAAIPGRNQVEEHGGQDLTIEWFPWCGSPGLPFSGVGRFQVRSGRCETLEEAKIGIQKAMGKFKQSLADIDKLIEDDKACDMEAKSEFEYDAVLGIKRK